MQSHDDSNHPKVPDAFKDLFGKAERMTAEGTNRITAGAPGERSLREFTMNGIALRQMPEDEHGVLRISVGEIPGVEQSGYFVWRGDTLRVCNLLERALDSMKSILRG